nr:hypothetical protein [Tanacetum cinerariifolium]
MSLYPFTERYAQPYFFSCLIRQMVNTRTDADLSAAVQNALQTLLPQIRAEIREEFRTSSRPSDSGGNPPLTDTETSTEFMQRFLRLAGFLGASAGTEEEQAKNFQWGLCRSTLNHLMCMSFTDVAQVANAARNYKILHERDDDDAERLDKRSYFMHVVLIRRVDVFFDFHMVNTRTDAELLEAVQNALQTLLPQIRAEIREEFRTGSGPSDSGGNPLSVNIHTWLESFNKQKPRSFEKATAPEFFLQFFPRAEQERLKREYHSIRKTDTETSTEFMQRFLRLAGFLGAAAGLRRSTLNYLMCIPFTDVAQVANAARNYEILHERDDDDAERPDKRQKSGDRHPPTTQQSSHKNHDHNNDRHGSDRRGGGNNHRSSNNNYSGNNNRLNFKGLQDS